ncbi:MAG: yeaC [Ilumatobacteraceae bacterium]|nr:yeaC [Ilumatobacteraceae bacterium]
MATQPIAERPDSFNDLHRALARTLGQVIQGKPEVIDLLLLGLIAEGHILVEDVPGTGKTTLAKALARSIDGDYGRIQFTPDLLPSDVVGVNVWNRSSGEFDFRPGPVFANVVLADEINRASPKTQSALLEAMAERQVTIDGTTRHLPPPFLVIATQNPIENEGTYPLPESQLDRFLLKVSMGYPDRESELEILASHGERDLLEDVRPVVTVAQVNGLAAAARTVHIAPSLQGYLVDLAQATRHHPNVSVGISPRATLALQRVARARAATRNRTYVTPDDVKAVAEPVLAHRLLLSPAARAGQHTAQSVIADVLTQVPQPEARPVQSAG